ncbi:MAG: antitoxin [Deltaproteobacteria bacterium]|nr:antitoxin [Deltaproteobacteria bacterium]
MKTITVRGVDLDLAKKLKQVASKEAKSVNQFVLEMLRQSVGMKKQKKFTRIYNDLDHLFGTWADAEFKAMNDKIMDEKKIDEELWKCKTC